MQPLDFRLLPRVDAGAEQTPTTSYHIIPHSKLHSRNGEVVNAGALEPAPETQEATGVLPTPLETSLRTTTALEARQPHYKGLHHYFTLLIYSARSDRCIPYP